MKGRETQTDGGYQKRRDTRMNADERRRADNEHRPTPTKYQVITHRREEQLNLIHMRTGGDKLNTMTTDTDFQNKTGNLGPEPDTRGEDTE